MKKDISDGLNLLRAMFSGDEAYIQEFIETKPERLSNRTFTQYDLQRDPETADLTFIGRHQFNLRDVATFYGYTDLAVLLEQQRLQIDYSISSEIDDLKNLCSMIADNNVSEFKQWRSYLSDFSGFLVPGRLAAAHFPQQAKFVGTATLLDLVLIWNRPSLYNLLKEKKCFLSEAVIANLQNVTLDQMDMMKGTSYFTGRMVQADRDYSKPAEWDTNRKKVKEIVKFDVQSLTRSAFSSLNTKMILALSRFKPSLVTTELKYTGGFVYADPLIDDVFLRYIGYGKQDAEDLIMALVNNSVKFEPNTLERLLSKMNKDRSRREYREDWFANAQTLIRLIIRNNPNQTIGGELLIDCLCGQLSQVTAYLLLQLNNVDYTAAYSIPGKRTKATLLEIVEKYQPDYAQKIKAKVMKAVPAADTGRSAPVSASGHYEIIPPSDLQTSDQILGEGSFGKIFKGQWNGAEVAIKVIDSDDSDLSVGFQSALVEAKILSRVRHPHIVSYYGVCTKESRFLFVMELQSTDLHSLIESFLKKGEIIPDNIKYSYIRQLLTALVFLQRKNILHRDIKPENVLVNADRSIVKLCDFGLAVQQDLGEQSYEPDKLAGSPFYIAPEALIQDPSYFSAKSDMYSFAMLLFVLMTQSTPWNDLNLNQLMDTLRQNKRPELEGTTIPKNVATLITFCWRGGPPKPQQSIEERYSAKQALEYFDTQIQPK